MLCDKCSRSKADSFHLQGTRVVKTCTACRDTKHYPIAALGLMEAARADPYYFTHMLSMNDRFLRFLRELLEMTREELQLLLTYTPVVAIKATAKKRNVQVTSALVAAIRSVESFGCWGPPMSPLTHSIVNEDESGDWRVAEHFLMFPCLALEVVPQDQGSWRVGQRLQKAVLTIAWRNWHEFHANFQVLKNNQRTVYSKEIVQWTETEVKRELDKYASFEEEEPFLVTETSLVRMDASGLSVVLKESWSRATKEVVAHTLLSLVVAIDNLHYSDALSVLEVMLAVPRLFPALNAAIVSSIASKALRLSRWKARQYEKAARVALKAFALMRDYQTGDLSLLYESCVDLADIEKSLDQKDREEVMVVMALCGVNLSFHSGIGRLRAFY